MDLKISQIQKFSLHDGPGIRTTFFLSGCPLHCLWCHNPETQSTKPRLMYEAKKCIGCGVCLSCPSGVHKIEGLHEVRREFCSLCGQCVKNCPTEALRFSMRNLSEQEFLTLVEEQQRVFGAEGGITFSGGEPLLQGDAILDLRDKIDVHTAIETCGYAGEELFRRVIDRMDYVMYDVKLADEEAHAYYTGVSNKPILRNLKILQECGVPHLIRTPLIPGITDTKENLDAIRALMGDSPWEKLPYNPLAPVKYGQLGWEFPLEG